MFKDLISKQECNFDNKQQYSINTDNTWTEKRKYFKMSKFSTGRSFMKSEDCFTQQALRFDQLISKFELF